MFISYILSRAQLTLGSILRGVVCLMKDLITPVRPSVFGVIMSIWFFCTVWRKDLMCGLIACIFKHAWLLDVPVYPRSPHMVNVSYTLTFLGRRQPLGRTFLNSIWRFAFGAVTWPEETKMIHFNRDDVKFVNSVKRFMFLNVTRDIRTSVSCHPACRAHSPLSGQGGLLLVCVIWNRQKCTSATPNAETLTFHSHLIRAIWMIKKHADVSTYLIFFSRCHTMTWAPVWECLQPQTE